MEELSDEVLSDINNKVGRLKTFLQRTELRNELSQKVAEINTLKSLPLNLPGSQGKRTGKGGPEV